MKEQIRLMTKDERELWGRVYAAAVVVPGADAGAAADEAVREIRKRAP